MGRRKLHIVGTSFLSYGRKNMTKRRRKGKYYLFVAIFAKETEEEG